MVARLQSLKADFRRKARTDLQTVKSLRIRRGSLLGGIEAPAMTWKRGSLETCMKKPLVCGRGFRTLRKLSYFTFKKMIARV